MRRWWLILLAIVVVSTPTVAGEFAFSGSVAVELRGFADEPAFSGQLDGGQGSLILNPEFRWSLSGDKNQVMIEPYFRLDGEDDERTHFDLRQAYWRYAADDWELLAGLNRVFWGVAESRHLVDIVNQTDLVEEIDGEDKLGQPMVNLAFQRNWGRLDLFLLPGFRDRTYPGADGRLRVPLPIDTDGARYQSGAGDRRLDLAARYSHYFGDFDLGVSYFHGTSREPLLTARADGQALIPFYQVIHQFGVDAQYTRGAWLWKLEAMGRQIDGGRFAAGVGGLEYTFYQLGRSTVDLGLLAEYLWDDRDPVAAPPTTLEDDLFVGSRLAFNDTQDTAILLGTIVDAHDGSTAGLLEAERRLGSRFFLEVEARWFADVDDENLLASLQQDSFLTMRLSFHF